MTSIGTPARPCLSIWYKLAFQPLRICATPSIELEKRYEPFHHYAISYYSIEPRRLSLLVRQDGFSRLHLSTTSTTTILELLHQCLHCDRSDVEWVVSWTSMTLHDASAISSAPISTRYDLVLYPHLASTCHIIRPQLPVAGGHLVSLVSSLRNLRDKEGPSCQKWVKQIPVLVTDRQYQLLKARALAAQQEREREMQYEIEAKAARLKAQRKEEEEVCPVSTSDNWMKAKCNRDERDRKQLVKKLEHLNSNGLMKL